jgi:hypothetical protein
MASRFPKLQFCSYASRNSSRRSLAKWVLAGRSIPVTETKHVRCRSASVNVLNAGVAPFTLSRRGPAASCARSALAARNLMPDQLPTGSKKCAPATKEIYRICPTYSQTPGAWPCPDLGGASQNLGTTRSGQPPRSLRRGINRQRGIPLLPRSHTMTSRILSDATRQDSKDVPSRTPSRVLRRRITRLGLMVVAARSSANATARIRRCMSSTCTGVTDPAAGSSLMPYPRTFTMVATYRSDN